MAVDPAQRLERVVSFGPFRLLTRQRLLQEEGKTVVVGSRALEILITLLERPGELVSKEELIARAWPSTHVVEGNLKFQVGALRRALREGQEGRRFLQTNPGRGYRFVGDVAVESEPAPPCANSGLSPRKHNVPARLTSFIGRAEATQELMRRISSRRLLTIVGPGGIGKTSLATTVAEQSIDNFDDGVWIVDLGRLSDPALVRDAMAATVGINVTSAPLEQLVAALSHAGMLLVLDNCSHVIDAVASLVVAVLKSAPGVHILATSREPLRVESEQIYRLGPLESPPVLEHLSAAEALRFPGVRLFVDRAAASNDGFDLHETEAPMVAEICRKLDGVPLAIELAAARVDVLGVRGLASHLKQGLQILTAGNRTAVPRHRTMRAALDWSFSLLSPIEQTVFTRLAAFAGGFTLGAAAALASDAVHPGEDIVSIVLELATKSLVAADADFAEPRFHLLQTTRAYARQKAKEKSELQQIAQRHATYFLELFEAASRDDNQFDREAAALGLEIDNLRAALSWAFAPQGNSTIGVRLAAASVPIWLSMSLIGEWHVWAERAIDRLDEAGLRGTRHEMILQATLGISFQLARGSAPPARPALARALEIAEQLGDAVYELRVLHTMWIYHMRVGEVQSAMTVARRAEAIAASLADPGSIATAEWMAGLALHWRGDHSTARQRLDRFLRGIPSIPRGYFIHRTGFDLYAVALYVIARILWLQGHPDQAKDALERSLDVARQLRHPVTLGSTLGFGACAHCFRTGDFEAAERFAAELVGYARKHGFADFGAFGMAVQEILSLRRGELETDAGQFRAALERWRASRWHILLNGCDLAEALPKERHVSEILAIIEEELELAQRNEALGTDPEALRLKGELLVLRDGPDSELAKKSFLRSLEEARAQGLLAWELRTAMSLARLERTKGRAEQGRRILQGVYDRFTEGVDDRDRKRAEDLLRELGQTSRRRSRSS
jgi:predicted ATPase/DNA-binding winged helix-turn-helix (wHTH) protein